MPELPEVEVTRRGLAPHLAGKTVTEVVARVGALPETAHPRGVEVARIEHVMSHVTLTLAVHRAEVSELPPKAFAVPASRLTDGPLPAPIKKLLSTLLFDAQLF